MVADCFEDLRVELELERVLETILEVVLCLIFLDFTFFLREASKCLRGQAMKLTLLSIWWRQFENVL
jgi:hypothetical protein